MTVTDSLVDLWLAEQRRLTPVQRFSARHEAGTVTVDRYRELIPSSLPGPGQQYRFEVDLDACTGCKACVVACSTMNGLDEDESWRSVGLLHGTEPGVHYQQTVTAGCHHCVDPACLDGCPVDAYEKDPVTGIVSHLDDQCIGCSYCTLTCPYEVPRYNPSRGIVRKCDMCQSRLAEGEAPACASACPNGAITIGIADVVVLEAAAATGGSLVPGAPASSVTIPSTEYRTARGRVDDVLAADRFAVRPGHAHDALTVMLVLTQLAVGTFVLGASAPVAVASSALAMAASVLHLGRPLYAWRAVIGLRHSWLSREVVAFGAFAGIAAVYAVLGWDWLHAAGAVAGMAGVACSVLLYARTRRRWWSTWRTTFRFAATTAACGAAAVGLGIVAAAVLTVKLLWELSALRHHGHDDLGKTSTLLRGELTRWFRGRMVLGALGALVSVWLPLVGLPLIVLGELVERRLFFTAVVAPRMPGVG